MSGDCVLRLLCGCFDFLGFLNGVVMGASDWREQIELTIEQTVASLIQNTPLQDLGDNAKTFLIGALQKLDVVTREEYEVQVAVLARTRDRLAELEAQVAQLERSLR